MDEPEPPDVPFALFYQGELVSPPEPETRQDVQWMSTCAPECTKTPYELT